MLSLASTLLLALTTSLHSADALSVDAKKRADYTATCSTITKAVSLETRVYFPGT